MKFLNFLRYNNAVPIGLFMLFGAGTAAFASTPEAQQAVYNTQEKVVSVDNTYIVNADIPGFQYQLQVTGVTEDAELYYIAYSYKTIDLKDNTWQVVTKSDTLKFTKKEIEGRDLGLEVSKQLGELIASEMKYLADVQKHERASGATQKVVTTEYSGLIGRFLDPTNKVFPGYTPVVAPPENIELTAGVANSGSQGGSGNSGGSTGGESVVLSLQVLGNNPVQLPLDTEYRDIGALLSDPTDPWITYKSFVNGVEKSPVTIFSSEPAVFEIEYRAVDQHGILVVARRVVLVGGAEDPGTAVNFAGSRNPLQPDTSTPPAENSAETNPPTQPPPVQEPPAENPPADEPAPADPPVVEPPAEEPPAENPPADTPPAQTPPPDPTPEPSPDPTQSTSTPSA